MGFFSDLKDDLSQAVNELGTEENDAAASGDFFEENKDKLQDMGDLSNEELDEMLNNLSDSDAQGSDSGDASLSFEGEVTFNEPAEENAENVQAEGAGIPMPSTSNKVANDEVSTIMSSMIINGNMATEGSLEVLGSIVGNVEALGKLNITGSIQGNSSASEIFAEGAKITGDVKSLGPIKVGQSSVIIGNISATSAVIAGAVKGDIDVKGPVILDASAIVMGDIKSKSVQINNGAVIEGMCSQCYAEVNPTSFFEELKKMR